MNWGSIWRGVQTVSNAVGLVFGDNKKGGTPGAGPAPSLISQKPNLSFERGSVGLGTGAGLMSGKGAIGVDVPSRFDSSNQWINLQAKYLQYLNMAEAFEDPGKVRRAIKLKVS
jgi:hypothetical protein|tara:strand:+ start:292 stop:633 length:342 start_codon:yes stop_codon:yes gene_type:complete